MQLGVVYSCLEWALLLILGADQSQHFWPINSRLNKRVHRPDSVPHYISAPFSTTGHGRATRFNMSNNLKCDFEKRLLTVGGCLLNHALPSVWNSLPKKLPNIQSFSCVKSSLKAFYFYFTLSRSLCKSCCF